MTDPSPIRRATAADVGAAAETLAAAFLDYPWTRWVIPEDDYAARLVELQRIYVQHAVDHGIVLGAADCAGVIALLPPAAPEPSAETLHRIVELHGERIARLGGEGGGDVGEASGAEASAADAGTANSAEEPAWRLETLGVRPEARGCGLGSALIAAALRAASEHGAASVALETSDPRNVALYERHGFEVRRHEAAAAGPDTWDMVATPGADRPEH